MAEQTHSLKHAMGILEQAESWSWPDTERTLESGKQGTKFKAITPKLLSGFISSSVQQGGYMLDQFWKEIRKGHPILKNNVAKIQQAKFVSPIASGALLFDGIDRDEVDFAPVLVFAGEIYTHLGVAMYNPGAGQIKPGTPFSVSDLVSKSSAVLKAEIGENSSSARRLESLKLISIRRDGTHCLLTDASFSGIEDGIEPILTHIIPHSIHKSSDTLNLIAMFAGAAARDSVTKYLNSECNTFALEPSAHTAFDRFIWGIEVITDDSATRYVYRRIPHTANPGPGFIRLRDGDEIPFGRGKEPGLDPLSPLLCNMHLAIARVMRMSGAAGLYDEMRRDADDDDILESEISPDDFADVITAKLCLLNRSTLA